MQADVVVVQDVAVQFNAKVAVRVGRDGGENLLDVLLPLPQFRDEDLRDALRQATGRTESLEADVSRRIHFPLVRN